MLRLLEVQPCALSFGCMQARDLLGNPATVVLYEDLRRRYVDNVPRFGDWLLCDHLHASVYRPIRRVIRAALCLRKLPLPDDVLRYYFPLTEPLKRL